MLAQRNGFYAFESALFVRGFGDRGGDILGWNSSTSWRQGYGVDAAGLFFFAEDVFGFQFAIDNDSIARFDPETGSRKVIASGLEDFFDQLLDDYNYWTGYPLAREWQSLHGPLKPGERLFPLRPFVLGGDFSVANLQRIGDLDGMELRSHIARQIRGLPDGTPVRLEELD